MKRLLNVTSVLLLIVASCVSCSKSNDVNTSRPVDPVAIATAGTWKVSSLTQRDEDKSSQLKSYVFTFGTGGVLTAEKSGQVSSGTWSFTPSAVTYYGSTPSNASIRISLGVEPFSQISRVWNVDSVNTTSTKLALISPEVAENLRLVFLKN